MKKSFSLGMAVFLILSVFVFFGCDEDTGDNPVKTVEGVWIDGNTELTVGDGIFSLKENGRNLIKGSLVFEDGNYIRNTLELHSDFLKGKNNTYNVEFFGEFNFVINNEGWYSQSDFRKELQKSLNDNGVYGVDIESSFNNLWNNSIGKEINNLGLFFKLEGTYIFNDDSLKFTFWKYENFGYYDVNFTRK